MGLPHLLLQDFPAWVSIVATVSIGVLFAGAYVYNELETRSGSVRFMLRLGGMFGSAALFFSKMESLEKRRTFSDIAMKNLESVSAATGGNAQNGVLTAQRNAVSDYAAMIDFSVNPVEFLHWISVETGWPLKVVFVLSAILFSLNIDLANTGLYHQDLRNSVLFRVFEQVSDWILRLVKALGPFWDFLGTLVAYLLGLLKEACLILFELLKMVRVWFGSISNRMLRKTKPDSGDQTAVKKPNVRRFGGDQTEVQTAQTKPISSTDSHILELFDGAPANGICLYRGRPKIVEIATVVNRSDTWVRKVLRAYGRID